MESMGLTLNHRKCIFASRTTKTLSFHGHEFEAHRSIDQLGSDIALDKDSPQVRPLARLHKAVHRVLRAGTLPGTHRYRDFILGTCVRGLVQYAPLGPLPSLQQDLADRLKYLQALIGQGHRLAQEECKEAHISYLAKSHHSDPILGRAVALVHLARRACLWYPQEYVEAGSHDGSLKFRVKASLARLGMDLLEGKQIVDATNPEDMVSLDSSDPWPKWAHAVRDLCRRALMRQAAKRRPREYGNLAEGVLTSSLAPFRNARCPIQESYLRRWHLGAVLSKERHIRHSRGAVSRFCPWCPEHVETMYHIFHCPQRSSGHICAFEDSYGEGLPTTWWEVGLLPRQATLSKEQVRLMHAAQSEAAQSLRKRDIELAQLKQLDGTDEVAHEPETMPQPQLPRRRLIGKQKPPPARNASMSQEKLPPAPLALEQPLPPRPRPLPTVRNWSRSIEKAHKQNPLRTARGPARGAFFSVLGFFFSG